MILAPQSRPPRPHQDEGNFVQIVTLLTVEMTKYVATNSRRLCVIKPTLTRFMSSRDSGMGRAEERTADNIAD